MGQEKPGVRIPAEALAKLLQALIQGARQSVRLRVEGESTRRGNPPAWLDNVTQFEVTGLETGSTVIDIDAPSLAEADPEMFATAGQTTLFGEEKEPLQTDFTGIDIFADSLKHALAEERDSVEFDKSILETILQCNAAIKDTYTSFEIRGLSWTSEPLRVSREGLEKVGALYRDVPEPQLVRLVGRLDTISATQPWVVLQMDSGEKVRARLEPFDPQQMHSLFNKDVVVSGTAYFRASRRLLRVEAEFIAEAEGQQTLWRKVPTPAATRLQKGSLRVAQDESSGVSAFFGTWPGDESDKEMLDSLKKMDEETE
jgi:hypothetical protein